MKFHWPRATLFAIALPLMPSMTTLAQSEIPGSTLGQTAYEATQIAGLSDAKPNTKGQLTLTATGLSFTNSHFKTEIPFTRITSTSSGVVRVETGGKTGQIARAVIPYGGGLAVATVTQKSVDLLTIEYLDLTGGYHGAVFYVPSASAQTLNGRISRQLSAYTSRSLQSCEAGPRASNSVVIEPIEASAVELPAEYRVLLYEGIVDQLRDRDTPYSYFRAGSLEGLSCPAMKLRITVTDFVKGSQALRAETGPLGMFVGKTSVSVHIELTAYDGHSLLSTDMTNSKRMDTASLGVATSVAKAVSKKIRKMSTGRSAS